MYAHFLNYMPKPDIIKIAQLMQFLGAIGDLKSPCA